MAPSCIVPLDIPSVGRKACAPGGSECVHFRTQRPKDRRLLRCDIAGAAQTIIILSPVRAPEALRLGVGWREVGWAYVAMAWLHHSSVSFIGGAPTVFQNTPSNTNAMLPVMIAASSTEMAAATIVSHKDIGCHDGLSGDGGASCPALALRHLTASERRHALSWQPWRRRRAAEFATT
jgi:hypothetical protein